MNAIFHEHISKIVKCYVDDIAVKNRAKGDHIADLKTIFDIMRAHQLKMNPTKSFLGVASCKFMRFVVTSKGMYLDPEKVRAVQQMQPLRNIRELRGLQGRLAYIQRFISNLSERCQPFTKLMKKGVSFVWDDACQQVFKEIKWYLTRQPPVLTAPVSAKPFLIYVRAMDHSLGALLVQNNEQRHEQAITIWVELWSEPNIGATWSKKNISRWCFPSRKCDIIWWVEPYTSYQKSIL